jgi:hypothetical protein
VKFTKYWQFIRQRPDRAVIRDEWIEQVVRDPVKEIVQKDGRIRRWAPINGKQILAGGITVRS